MSGEQDEDRAMLAELRRLLGFGTREQDAERRFVRRHGARLLALAEDGLRVPGLEVSVRMVSDAATEAEAENDALRARVAELEGRRRGEGDFRD